MPTKKFIYAVGRRKEAAARVRLFKGNEESQVNGKGVKDYFPAQLVSTALAPLIKTGSEDKFYFTAKVSGGGAAGQSEAVALGLARSIVEMDAEEFKNKLKREGLLKRDPRIRQRRMVGMGGKSRRKKQSPKR